MATLIPQQGSPAVFLIPRSNHNIDVLITGSNGQDTARRESRWSDDYDACAGRGRG
jgi:hypothetical protein